MQIAQGTWIVVADGQKFLLLRNIGDAEFLHLEVVAHNATKTPPARDLGSDRPGRRHDAARPVRGGVDAWGKSAMEQTDWHRVAEERFAATLADRLADWAAADRFTGLVLFADPRTLGALRDAMTERVKALVLAQIDKDLTNLPLDRIEAVVAAENP